MSYAETWDETKPAGSRARSLGDDDIREFKRAIRERLATDHDIRSDETGITTIGYHTKTTLIEQASAPSNVANTGILYTMDAGGITELYYKDSAGTAKQITNNGKLKVTAADIAAIADNVDFGAYSVTAQTLVLDVADGTAPMTITSTTKVSNLNADKVDGYDVATSEGASKIYASDASNHLPNGAMATNILDYGTSLTTGTQKELGALKIAYGILDFASASPQTVTGLPFTNSTSYKVAIIQEYTGPAADSWVATIAYVSGSSFSVYHQTGSGRKVNWIAIGT